MFQKYFNLLFQSPLSDTVLVAISFSWSWLLISPLLFDLRFFLMELFGFAPQCTEPIGNYFSAAEAGFIVLLWRGRGWVKASRHDLHLFTLSWSSFMWQRWPPLSFRINLTSSNSFSFCKKLGTETVLKKFCYENLFGALAILFNTVVNR